MTDFDDMRFLRVDAAEAKGEYRMMVFELDPMSEACSIDNMFEGTMAALALTIESQDRLFEVPIFVRDSEHACNPGEVLLACGTRVVEPPRDTAIATLERALEIHNNPPAKFEDTVPQTTATELINVLVEGKMADMGYDFPNGERARFKYNCNDDGIKVLLVSDAPKAEWQLSMDTGVFTRLR